MTREYARKLVKSILDKKIPCKLAGEEVPSSRINHIISTNVSYRDKEWLPSLIFWYDHQEVAEDYSYSIEYLHNRTFDIWIKVKERYIICIGDSSKSHWKIVGYDFID